MEYHNRHVLLLNSTYEVIDIITWKRAIILYFKGRVKIYEEFSDSVIHSASSFMKMPSIVICLDYVGYLKNVRKVVNLNRVNVLLRDNHKCMYCLRQLNDKIGTIDHVFPLSRGGRNIWSNVVASCMKCNRKKDADTPEEAGMTLHVKPYSPTRSIFYNKFLVKDEYRCWSPFFPAIK
jgi:5-methylcytosine-specific restriction endonuclease McrA